MLFGICYQFCTFKNLIFTTHFYLRVKSLAWLLSPALDSPFFSTRSPLSPPSPFSSLPNSVNHFVCSKEWRILQFSSVQSLSHVRLFLTHESQHARTPCPSPSRGVHSDSWNRVRDAIQPSHPRSFPSPPAPNPSQHQSLFQWVNSSHGVAKVLEFQL